MPGKFYILLFFIPFYCFSQHNEIRLIVRADDIGFCHAANEAIINVYKNGIARSAEVIVPAPWFMEAVKLLNENPSYDVGIHLCLTSEWTYYKWRPMTYAPSLTDSNGYFFPFIWVKDFLPANSGNYLIEKKPNIKEIEKEFRAQIETGKKHIKNVSHISSHMGCAILSGEVNELVDRLAKEYGLYYDKDVGNLNLPSSVEIIHFNLAKGNDIRGSEKSFIEKIKNLKFGDHLFLSHPCKGSDESNNISNPGEMEMSKYRAIETQLLTSKKVKQVIKEKNIKLITVKEAFNGN